MSRSVEARNVEFLTARQRVVVECVERHGGNMAAAARELEVTPVTVSDTYRRALTRLDPSYAGPEQRPRRLTAAELAAMIPGRLDAIEQRLESMLASDAALSVTMIDLTNEIRAWTKRQPIYVEMRPRHDRKADGGQGGVHEARALKKGLTDG